MVLFSEIKSYVVVLSFYIKMMRRRISHVNSLKHIIKKSMFSVSGKLDLFMLGRGRGDSAPTSPSPPAWLRACLYNSFFKGQLSYCPLIWTFCSSLSNNLINKL